MWLLQRFTETCLQVYALTWRRITRYTQGQDHSTCNKWWEKNHFYQNSKRAENNMIVGKSVVENQVRIIRWSDYRTKCSNMSLPYSMIHSLWQLFYIDSQGLIASDLIWQGLRWFERIKTPISLILYNNAAMALSRPGGKPSCWMEALPCTISDECYRFSWSNKSMSDFFLRRSWT